MAGKNTKANDIKSFNETSDEKSAIIDDIWQNYDTVFKDAVSMFKDKSLDFFGLPKDITILEPLKTETKEITVKSEFADLTFKLSNGKGLHFESETALSKDDLFRFCEYHIDLIRTYGFDFKTVIFVKDSHSQESLNYEMLMFTPIVINCGEYNADLILSNLKEQAVKGEKLNELEVIYLPLFKSERYNPEELLMESIRLINAAQIDNNQKRKISALTIVLSNKLVDANKLEELWRELVMMNIKILDYAEKKGEEKGIEKGEKKAEERMKHIKELFSKNNLSPKEISEKEKIPEKKVREILNILGLLD